MQASNLAGTSRQNRSIFPQGSQEVTKCGLCGKKGHDRSICRYNKIICYRKRGHIERNCNFQINSDFSMKEQVSTQKLQNFDTQRSQNYKKNKNFNTSKNINVIGNSNELSKFYKNILINGYSAKAFVDSGSECSLIKSSMVKKLKFKACELENHIKLNGFLGKETTLTQYICARTEIDGWRVFRHSILHY